MLVTLISAKSICLLCLNVSFTKAMRLRWDSQVTETWFAKNWVLALSPPPLQAFIASSFRQTSNPSHVPKCTDSKFCTMCAFESSSSQMISIRSLKLKHHLLSLTFMWQARTVATYACAAESTKLTKSRGRKQMRSRLRLALELSNRRPASN